MRTFVCGNAIDYTREQDEAEYASPQGGAVPSFLQIKDNDLQSS